MISNNPRETRRRWLRLPPVAAVLAALVSSGCRHDDSAPFKEWIPAHPESMRRGAYAELRQVGVEAEAAVRAIQHRAAPSSKEVAAMDAKLAPIMSAATQACALPVVDDYTPEASLAPSRSRIGWAALGGAFERRVHAAIAKQDFDSAARFTADGTRFAMIISCGDASDALVGYPIADALRRMLGPVLRDLSAAQLSKVAAAVSQALSDRLPFMVIAAHERLAMLA